MHTPFIKSHKILGRYPEKIDVNSPRVYFCAFCGIRLFQKDQSPWYQCECPKAQEFMRKSGKGE